MVDIAIADDFKIFREGIKVGLLLDKNIRVVLEADDGEELLKGMENIVPKVVIMDLKMPVMDGIEATIAVRKKFPDVKVLVMTMYDDDKFVIHLMEIGANGYLLKNADSDEIVRAIHSVCETGYYFNDRVNQALLKRLFVKSNTKPTFKESVEFTERELDVLRLICSEKSNGEIARELFLSPRTVEGIRQRLVEKVGVRNTAGLVIYAVKNQLF